MFNSSVKWLCVVGATASIIGVAVPVLTLTPSSTLAQSPSRNSAVTTGDQGPAIGSNNGNVYNNYYNTGVKEKPADPRSHLLIGRWKGVQKHVMVDGQLIFTGYTRLNESGSYSNSGELSVQSIRNGRRIEVILLVQAAGTWTLDGNKYSITVADIKTQYKVQKEEGQPDIDLSNPLISSALHWLPKFEDTIPRGSSQECEIVELTSSTLKARGKDIKGIEFFYEGVRQ
jgi:hypothetical protein